MLRWITRGTLAAAALAVAAVAVPGTVPVAPVAPVALLPSSAAALSAGSTSLTAYSASIRTIDAALAYRMRYSWRRGCPVPLSDLRYLRMTYLGFDGVAHSGEMVVHRVYAANVVAAFRRVYASRFPIRRMRLVDVYGGSDAVSMNADNTSAFNCRRTTSGTAWSQHSYGRAVDINPIENPYVSHATVEPTAGRAYVTRWPLRKGMLTWTARDAFHDIGWYWGGSWTSLKDYMHFSSNNR
jgi:poly-gamma-glutamate synthesis protein (capsule biosynthesis protein)